MGIQDQGGGSPGGGIARLDNRTLEEVQWYQLPLSNTTRKLGLGAGPPARGVSMPELLFNVMWFAVGGMIGILIGVEMASRWTAPQRRQQHEQVSFHRTVGNIDLP